MTKMLEQAVEKVRELPEADQDVAADILFGLAAKRSDADDLDEETIAAINEGLAHIERGKSQLMRKWMSSSVVSMHEGSIFAPRSHI